MSKKEKTITLDEYREMVKESAMTLGALGGKSKSEAKQCASRENGKKGGRPRTKKPEDKKV